MAFLVKRFIFIICFLKVQLYLCICLFLYLSIYIFYLLFSFGFIEALDLTGILNLLKEGITSAMEYADETVFTFARAMVQIKQFVLIK